jgi:hypothetical protein
MICGEVSLLGFWDVDRWFAFCVYSCDWLGRQKTIFVMHLSLFDFWGFCFGFALVLSCMPGSRSSENCG